MQHVVLKKERGVVVKHGLRRSSVLAAVDVNKTKRWDGGNGDRGGSVPEVPPVHVLGVECAIDAAQCVPEHQITGRNSEEFFVAGETQGDRLGPEGAGQHQCHDDRPCNGRHGPGCSSLLTDRGKRGVG